MYGMLSSGLIDIVVEDTLKAHDYMALVPVIQGAGGVITDKYNNPITFRFRWQCTCYSQFPYTQTSNKHD